MWVHSLPSMWRLSNTNATTNKCHPLISHMCLFWVLPPRWPFSLPYDVVGYHEHFFSRDRILLTASLTMLRVRVDQVGCFNLCFLKGRWRFNERLLTVFKLVNRWWLYDNPLLTLRGTCDVGLPVFPSLCFRSDMSFFVVMVFSPLFFAILFSGERERKSNNG